MTMRTPRQWMMGLSAATLLAFASPGLIGGAGVAHADSGRRDSDTRGRSHGEWRDSTRSEWREHGRSEGRSGRDDHDRYRSSGRDRDRHDDRDRRRDDDHDRSRLGIRLLFGAPICPPIPAPCDPPPSCGTIYEERIERVCVEPEHYETRCIPAVTETRYDHCGRPYQVIVCPARYERVLVPARYETRVVRVPRPAPCPPVYEPCGTGLRIGIGGIFRF